MFLLTELQIERNNLKKELPLLLIKLRKEKRKKDIPVIVFASIENYNLNIFIFSL